MDPGQGLHDTFCPLGPWDRDDRPLADAVVQCSVNGEVRQSAPSSDMITDVGGIIAHVSSVMTLLPAT